MSDEGSGISATSCDEVNTPAYSFGLGQRTLTRTATDIAGNTATATVTVAVAITPEVVAGALAPLVVVAGIAVWLVRRRCVTVVPEPLPTPEAQLP